MKDVHATPQVLKREYPALQKIHFFTFSFPEGHFARLDPHSDPTDQNQCQSTRIHNSVLNQVPKRLLKSEIMINGNEITFSQFTDGSQIIADIRS